ncbi:major facilitator superfamily domain-containing protein 9-like [Chelonus insularis]|uniref:major facilitator superfamily domain-containing protein 9-like n=1 Tax=Chelonus insularis TaxID=460826 RepID=UPI00158F0F64|nr:major facilitator superfamily domain-containing protein 9-like [Chelonus insularis]
MNYQVRWIFIAAFLDLFAVSLILPSLSAHLKTLQASYLMIGMMTSIYAATQLLSGPIIGSWSDKIGRQKIFIISYFIVGCCYPIIGILKSLYLILFLRAIMGIFKHGQVLLRTMITDQTPIKQQPLLFGRLKSVAGISFTIGPAIGGHIAELDRGFFYISCCTGALLVINSVIGYIYFRDLPRINSIDQSETKSDSVGIIDAIKNLMNIKWLMFGEIFLLKFMLDMSTGIYHSNYNLKIQEKFDLSPKLSGYTIAFQSLVGVLTGIFVEDINNKLYKNDENYCKRNLHGFLFMSIAYLGIYFASHLSVFLFWTVILKTSHMFLRIILTDMLMRKCPTNHTGSVTGTANSVSNLARLVTPLLAGLVEDMWEKNSTNFLAAVISTIGVGISFSIKSTDLRKNQ